MKQSRFSTLIASLAVTLLLTPFVSASPDREDIEVITVTGDQSLAQMRSAIKQNRLEFYEAYNEINTEKYFDMLCEYRSKAGSNIKHIECEPRYVRLIRSEKIQDSFQSMALNPAMLPNDSDLVPYLRSEHEKAEAHMAKLIEENPELTDKWNDLLIAVYRYESQKALEKDEE
ncbi:hypothetical protein AltI4_21870 [Alteromonas sp. I4]|nr:hypothetical protein AltI4_21870 [Alteromonas sp. I4]